MQNNFTKTSYVLPRLTIPRGCSIIIHDTVVCKYLENYAKYFGLESLIKYKSEVLSNSPKLPKSCNLHYTNRFVKWNVEYKELDTTEELHDEFEGVVVCNGYVLGQ